MGLYKIGYKANGKQYYTLFVESTELFDIINSAAGLDTNVTLYPGREGAGAEKTWDTLSESFLVDTYNGSTSVKYPSIASILLYADSYSSTGTGYVLSSIETGMQADGNVKYLYDFLKTGYELIFNEQSLTDYPISGNNIIRYQSVNNNNSFSGIFSNNTDVGKEFGFFVQAKNVQNNYAEVHRTMFIIVKDGTFVENKINEIGEKDFFSVTVNAVYYYSNKKYSTSISFRRSFPGSTKSGFGALYFDKEAEEVTPGPTPGGGDDPYNPGGSSGPGGGQGSFDPSGDDVTIPALPTLSALSTGFISLFTPTIAELNNLSSYMWNNDLFSLDTWKKIFANPMDAILGLSIVPVAVPSAGQVDVTVGNISTGVSMTKASAQYVTVDCGSVTIPEYWGAYLDYDPYTKMELYLPYIGIVPVKADDIIGKQIHVAYHVDILSGACCAMVQCGNSILYTYNGSCAMQIPVSGVDMTTAISSVISATASVAAMLATGGAGSLLGGAITAGAITNTANSVMNAKPTVQHSGSMTGPGGQLGVQTPYFIVTRPRQCVAENQNNLVGLPAFFTVTLGDVSGYTEVEDIHLSGIPATVDELQELENLLKGGVIF